MHVAATAVPISSCWGHRNTPIYALALWVVELVSAGIAIAILLNVNKEKQ